MIALVDVDLDDSALQVIGGDKADYVSRLGMALHDLYPDAQIAFKISKAQGIYIYNVSNRDEVLMIEDAIAREMHAVYLEWREQYEQV